MDKRIFKKSSEELEQYLAFKRKGFKVPAKKGKGSYNRNKFKNYEKVLDKWIEIWYNIREIKR